MILFNWVPSLDVVEVTAIALEGSQQVVSVSCLTKSRRIILFEIFLGHQRIIQVLHP
jgi:hypothetical protein